MSNREKENEEREREGEIYIYPVDFQCINFFDREILCGSHPFPPIHLHSVRTG